MRAIFRQEQTNASQQPPLFEGLLELIPQGKWLTPKEAAAALGMEPDSFRAAYCDRERPRVQIFQRPGPNGGRRVLVSQRSVEALLRSGLVGPE